MSITLSPIVQTYCSIHLEYRQIRTVIIFQGFKVESVQTVSFCVLTPIMLQVNTDVSDNYSVSICRDEGIGLSWYCCNEGDDVVWLHGRIAMNEANRITGGGDSPIREGASPSWTSMVACTSTQCQSSRLWGTSFDILASRHATYSIPVTFTSKPKFPINIQWGWEVPSTKNRGRPTTSDVRFGSQKACVTAGQHLGESIESEAARKMTLLWEKRRFRTWGVTNT